MPPACGARGLCLAVVAVALWLSPEAGVAQPRPGEYEVKAAFIYNFARFAEWPTPRQAGAELVVCVLGEDPFGEAIGTIEGREVRGRRIAIRHAASPSEVGPCDILYISPSESAGLSDLLPYYRSRAVLTVSDIARFAESGGIVQLTMSGTKVRFRVNVEAAERAGIRLSAKLLRLAEVVDGS